MRPDGYRWRFRPWAGDAKAKDGNPWRYCERDPQADGLICETEPLFTLGTMRDWLVAPPQYPEWTPDEIARLDAVLERYYPSEAK